MAHQLEKPNDPYDPAWVEYRRQNPGLRLGLSADVPDDTSAVDYAGVLPDTFKGEDGAWDVEGFKTHFDELASFKAQADEAAATMPKEAADYVFSIGDDFQFPEGFDPSLFKQPVLNDKGEPVLDENGQPTTRDFQASDLIDPNDPDLPMLQEAMLAHGAKPELMGELAKILAGRELRKVSEMADVAKAEKEALGPNGKARIDVLSRTISARVPKEQASALLDGLTSANAVRAMEALLKPNSTPPAPGGKHQDYSSMSIDDRIMAGLQERKSA